MLFRSYLPATFDEVIACTVSNGGNNASFGMTLAQAFYPGSDSTGQGQWPYFDGYNTLNFSNANKVCNTG